jgi:hypothetical protein
MESEELKNLWTLYDKKLTENLKFNEEILRKMNMDNSKKEMNSIFKYEIVSVITYFIAFFLLFTATFRNAGELKYLLPGIISTGISLILLILSIRKTKHLSDIEYYNSPIVDLQKSVSKAKQKYRNYKKFEFYIFPLYAITFMPPFAKLVRNVDFYAIPYQFLIAVGGAIGLGYPLIIWIYKHWYEKKLTNVDKFLEELNRFENE